MNFRYAPNFKNKLRRFSKQIRKKFYEQADNLLNDLRHPSLRAKKFDEAYSVWQARVNRNIRFYFLIEKDTYIFIDIKKHSD